MCMAFYIDNPEFERLANTLAAQTGETPTEAVLNSLRARLHLRETKKIEDKQRLFEAAMEISRRCADLPVFDNRSPEEILGYDENGLPS